MERVSRLIQQVVAEIILERLNDPRIDPARVSVTRVEVAEDFTRAKVFFSVMGSTEAEDRNVERALRHAGGRIQELMMNEISLRFTPILEFVLDVQFKKSLTTLTLISQAMRELHEREQANAPQAGDEKPAEEDDADEELDTDRDELVELDELEEDLEDPDADQDDQDDSDEEDEEEKSPGR